jgi:isopenicillin-N N-acyltransferase like protein
MPIDIIDLPADPRARGCVFGRARRAHIRAYISDWLDSLRAVGIADPQEYVATFLRETDFLTDIRTHAPGLLEEVRGIIECSGQPHELVLGTQFMDEEWAYRPSYFGRGEALQKCSSVAIRSEKDLTWIGQNMDLWDYTDGHQLLLRMAAGDGEPGALVFTVGGMIGLLGVNSSGVGVCVNSLPQLPSARKGVPVAFVIRRLLRSHCLTEAAQTLREIPHATGQHYLIADCTGARSFEASPAGVVEYHSPDPYRVLHTNHPLAEKKGSPYAASAHANTVARLTSLTTRLMSGSPGLNEIKAALSSSDDPDHPVCRLPNPNGRPGEMMGLTTGSMISRLQDGARSVDSWVSAGPPSLRGYTQVHLPGVA